MSTHLHDHYAVIPLAYLVGVGKDEEPALSVEEYGTQTRQLVLVVHYGSEPAERWERVFLYDSLAARDAMFEKLRAHLLAGEVEQEVAALDARLLGREVKA